MSQTRYRLRYAARPTPGRCGYDNERLCAMERRLRLEIIMPTEIEPGAASSVGQRLTHCATGLQNDEGTLGYVQFTKIQINL